MVAYSFKARFVDAIAAGLGWRGGNIFPRSAPKRQTIRAHGKRAHARPGDELQLYCGMRSKHCFLIGRARCVSVEPISLWPQPSASGPAPAILTDLGLDRFGGFAVIVSGTLLPRRRLIALARADGFEDVEAMRRFWLAEHGTGKFQGVLIKWKPL